MNSADTVAVDGQWNKPPIGRRWLRVARWSVVGLVVVFTIFHVHTATVGTRHVKAAILAETTAEYRSLKSRAPGAIDPNFPGPNFRVCRAVFPGIIECNYTVHYGGKAGGEYESQYWWNGLSCQRRKHKVLAMY